MPQKHDLYFCFRVAYVENGLVDATAYSHLSNKSGGWNKCEGWDFVEKTNA